MKTTLTRVLALLTLPTLAAASDLVVAPGGSIQGAIDAAMDGDRVLVQPGTYHERINFDGKAIQVLGIGGADQTTLDADLLGTVVRFENGEGPASRLAGFTITRGASSGLAGGGIIAAPPARPTIEDCIIRGNLGKYGAGVHGNPILLRCTIRLNTASTSFGGGVWGAPELYDCIISENTVTSGAGGGLFLTGGPAIVRGCRIEGNSAVFGQGRGAGIHVNSTATALIDRCVIIDNFGSAGVFGAYGGGIFVEASGTTVVNCTILDNSLFGSSVAGGGIYGPAVVRNSIVRGNAAPQLEAVVAATYSDVEGGFAGMGNFDLDPLFVNVALDDFHLSSSSPCIDAGDPQDPLDANGSAVDMGALPFDLPAPTTYCLGAPNSLGSGARIGWSGTQSISAGNFELQAHAAPPGQFGVFYYGPAETQAPFGDGFQCVAANGVGLFRFNPPLQIGNNGSTALSIDFTTLPASAGAGAITAGSTWNFQFWYRDPSGPGGGGFNLSDALHASFVF